MAKERCAKQDATCASRSTGLPPAPRGRRERAQPLASRPRAGGLGGPGRRGHVRAARLARPPARPRVGSTRICSTPAARPPADRPARGRGAEPGDLLELEVLAYETDDFGWTGDLARLGLPRRPVRASLPRALGARRIPRALGAAPRRGGRRLRARRHHRRRAVVGAARARPLARGRRRGSPNPPTPELAWPPAAAEGLRTYPPRENGGNMDIRDLGPGRAAVAARARAGRAALGRRPALRPGRRRGLHLRHRDRRLSHVPRRPAPRRLAPTFPCYEAPPRPRRARLRHHRHPAHRRRRARPTSTSTWPPGAPCSSCSTGSRPSTASAARRPTC